MTEAASDWRWTSLCGQQLRRDCVRRRRDEALRMLIVSEQRFDFRSQVLIAVTGCVQKGRALVRRTLQRGVIQLFDLLPTFRRHCQIRKDLAAQTLSSLRLKAYALHEGGESRV